jgi:hypothetical protein
MSAMIIGGVGGEEVGEFAIMCCAAYGRQGSVGRVGQGCGGGAKAFRGCVAEAVGCGFC